VLKGLGAAGAVSVFGFPAVVRGQVKEIKIGSIQPMTGVLSVVGKTTRQANQLAVDHVRPLAHGVSDALRKIISFYF